MIFVIVIGIVLLFEFFFFKFFFKIGPWIRPKSGWMGPAGPDGASLGLKKKTRLLNGLGSGNELELVGWVQA